MSGEKQYCGKGVSRLKETRRGNKRESVPYTAKGQVGAIHWDAQKQGFGEMRL
jgi:hypothetical protein